MSAPQTNYQDLRRIRGGLPDRQPAAQLPPPQPTTRRLKRQAESVLDGLRRKGMVDEAEKGVR